MGGYPLPVSMCVDFGLQQPYSQLQGHLTVNASRPPAHLTVALPRVHVYFFLVSAAGAGGRSVDVTCALHVSPRDVFCPVSASCVGGSTRYHTISLRPFADLDHTIRTAGFPL